MIRPWQIENEQIHDCEVIYIGVLMTGKASQELKIRDAIHERDNFVGGACLCPDKSPDFVKF